MGIHAVSDQYMANKSSIGLVNVLMNCNKSTINVRQNKRNWNKIDKTIIQIYK